MDPIPFPGSQKPPFSMLSGTLIKRLKKPRSFAPFQKTFIQGALPKQKATESRRNPELYFGEMSMKHGGNARRRVLGQGRRMPRGPWGESGIQSAPRLLRERSGQQRIGLSRPATLSGDAPPCPRLRRRRRQVWRAGTGRHHPASRGIVSRRRRSVSWPTPVRLSGSARGDGPVPVR